MEDIAEALQIIKDWNPNHSLKFFISDYSEAEMLAVVTSRFTYAIFIGNSHGSVG